MSYPTVLPCALFQYNFKVEKHSRAQKYTGGIFVSILLTNTTRKEKQRKNLTYLCNSSTREMFIVITFKLKYDYTSCFEDLGHKSGSKCEKGKEYWRDILLPSILRKTSWFWLGNRTQTVKS